MWKMTATPWCSNELQHRVELGVGEGPAIDRADRDHRRGYPGRRKGGQLGVEPVRVAERDMADRVEPTSSRRPDPLHGPAVPRFHVGQLRVQTVFERAHPEQTEIREHESLVDSLVSHQVDPGTGVTIVSRERVEGNSRRQPRTLPEAPCAHRHDVAGRVDLRQVDVRAIGSGQPRITQSVLLNPDRQVPPPLGKMLRPQRARLDEVGIGIDHGFRHRGQRREGPRRACVVPWPDMASRGARAYSAVSRQGEGRWTDPGPAGAWPSSH